MSVSKVRGTAIAGVAGGYAPLDSSTLIPYTYLPNLSPVITGWVTQGATNGTSHSTTIAAQSSGKRIVMAVSSYNRDVNTPTCTNVTFSEVLGVNFSTGAYLSIYLGIATGTTGTSISTTATGSNWIIVDTYLIDDQLTGSVVTSATSTDTSAAAKTGQIIGPVTAPFGSFFVAGAAQNDGSTGLGDIMTNSIRFQNYHAANAGLVSAIGRMSGTSLSAYYTGGTSGGDMASGIVVFS